MGEKPPSTRAPVCSVPLGPGLGAVHSSPGPCPAFVVTCAFDPCPPEPLIYTKDCCFKKKKKKAVREKICYIQGKLHKAIRRFFRKTCQNGTIYSKVMKFEKTKKKTSNQSQIFYLAKSSFRTEGDKQKLKTAKNCFCLLSRQAKAKGDNHH